MKNSHVRVIALFSMVILLANCAVNEEPKKEKGYPISAIDIKDVRLTDGFWLPKVKLLKDTTIKHAFEKCAEEGRMDNFLIAGGQMEGTTKGKMPFDDTDLYKIIEGASYSLVSMPDPELDAYLDSIIAIIAVGQEPDGYLTTWFTIDRDQPPAWWVNPPKHRWEEEITSHELYNSGHLFEAAAAHYHATGKTNLLDIATKNADLLVANFGPDTLTIPPGHQIIETGLIRLYDITKNENYLKLSKFFIDLRGDSSTHTLYGEYNQDSLPVTQQFEAVGHAVRAEYMYAAMTDLVARYGDEGYLNALNKLWDNVVNKKMYITGGVGSRHDKEAFGNNYELPNLSAYNETCAAIGSVAWNQKMFLLTGDVKYIDIIERTLYNGFLAGISTDGKKFFYPNPLESDGKFVFNHGACTRQSWFDCSCCPTNVIRFMPSLQAYIYASQADTIFANLFISSDLEVNTSQGTVSIKQQTDYPWSGQVMYTINVEQPATLTLKVRVPGWLRNEAVPGNLYAYTDEKNTVPTIAINGASEQPEVRNGYMTLTREWNDGDVLVLNMPMDIRKVVTNEIVKENNNKVAFERGPIVYCAEEADNPQLPTLGGIPASADWTTDKQILLGQNVNVLKSDIAGQPLTLIPYYLWSNRGVGHMKVWLPQQ